MQRYTGCCFCHCNCTQAVVFVTVRNCTQAVVFVPVTVQCTQAVVFVTVTVHKLLFLSLSLYTGFFFTVTVHRLLFLQFLSHRHGHFKPAVVTVTVTLHRLLSPVTVHRRCQCHGTKAIVTVTLHRLYTGRCHCHYPQALHRLLSLSLYTGCCHCHCTQVAVTITLHSHCTQCTLSMSSYLISQSRQELPMQLVEWLIMVSLLQYNHIGTQHACSHPPLLTRRLPFRLPNIRYANILSLPYDIPLTIYPCNNISL